MIERDEETTGRSRPGWTVLAMPVVVFVLTVALPPLADLSRSVGRFQFVFSVMEDPGGWRPGLDFANGGFCRQRNLRVGQWHWRINIYHG